MQKGFFNKYGIVITALACFGFGILSVTAWIAYKNGGSNSKALSAILFGIVTLIKIFELAAMIRKRNLEQNNSEAL